MKFLLPLMAGLSATSASFLGGIFSQDNSWQQTFNDFSNATYQAQTAQQKSDQLWAQLTANTSITPWYSNLQLLGIFLESMTVTTQTESDVLVPGRKKYIHTAAGSVAKAQFIADPNSPYPGVFQGAENVIIRISTAKQPDPTNSEAYNNFVPALGVKFLRDGVPSANVLIMRSVNGQENWNPFGFQWSNHIPAPQGAALNALATKFKQASQYPTTVGLIGMAQYDQTGKATVGTPKIPFRIAVRPTDAVSSLFPETYQDDLYKQLATIANGTVLYDVYAWAEPLADPVVIGSIQLMTQFTPSAFGDNRLFFQHIAIEEDLAINPQWTAFVANNTLSGDEKLNVKTVKEL